MVPHCSYGGHWRIIVTAIGLLILPPNAVAQQPVDQAAGRDDGPKVSQTKPANNPNPSALLAIKDSLDAIVRELGPSKEDREQAAEEISRAKQDLRAQQDMALWALLMVVATFAQLFLSGAGIWLVWQTLKATRDAVREAKEATEAAANAVGVSSEANEIAKEVFTLDQRPWLSVKVEPAGPIEWRDNGCHLDLKVTITNTGKSPAFRVFIETKATPWPPMAGHNDYDTIKEYMAKKRHWRWDGGPTIFPGETIYRKSGFHIEQKNVIETIEKLSPTSRGMEPLGRIAPSVMGFVGYFSLFQETSHQTFYEFWVHGTPVGHVNLRMSPANGDIPIGRIQLTQFIQTAGMD